MAQASLCGRTFVHPLVQSAIFSLRVLLQVDDQFVDGGLAEGMQIDRDPEFTQRLPNVLVIAAQALDLAAMVVGDERKQAAFFGVEVITKVLLEASPLFTQFGCPGTFYGRRQLRQELLEGAMIADQASFDFGCLGAGRS